MMPDKTLSPKNLSGVKKDKGRISVAVTVNGTGDLRPPLWVVGSAKRPVCMRGIDKENLGIVWRSNKKAWMTSAIIIEYLFWFDK